MRRTGGRERGSATVEAVIGVPAFLLFLGLLVLGGRVTIAHQAVTAAAADAARAASIARTEASAQADAIGAAQQSLANQQQDCAGVTVSLDTTGFGTQAGTAAEVRATVACQINLADLGLPAGTRTIAASMSSPIDNYRERR